MKKTFLLALAMVLCLGANAQRAREEIKANVNLAANNYYAYPTPTKALTPAPKGYEPFYISHYGRHGSRWVIGKANYDEPYTILSTADSEGKLTPKGKEVLATVKAMRDNGRSREGELTLLGAQQHQGIAKRMYQRFPQVFAGKTNVDAKSTVVIRCIISMVNEVLQLQAMNPQIKFTTDASYHDMYYMNDEHGEWEKQWSYQNAMDSLNVFFANHDDCSHLMSVLFNDASYAKKIDAAKLGTQLFELNKDIQDTELRHSVKTFWDAFSFDEIYNQWAMTNAYWYTKAGPNKTTNGAGMYTQVNLLKNIIETADTCVVLSHPGATMRFAHESDVLPLVCLLNLNGFGNPRSSLENLDDENWNAYDVFPMACNVQFIFYNTKKNIKSGKMTADDALVKVLLNENEATLPIKTDKAPYYHWKDVRAYMQGKIDTAKALK